MSEPTVTPGDVVFVTNHADSPLVVEWDSRAYVVKSNQKGHMPFEASCRVFGDPRAGATMASNTIAKGLVEFIPDRATEVRRLRMLYGAPLGDETTFDGVPALPDVTVETADGEPLKMVISDPEGRHLIKASPSMSESDDLMDLVIKMRGQIKALESQAGVQSDETIADEEALPSDDSALDIHFASQDLT